MSFSLAAYCCLSRFMLMFFSPLYSAIYFIFVSLTRVLLDFVFACPPHLVYLVVSPLITLLTIIHYLPDCRCS